MPREGASETYVHLDPKIGHLAYEKWIDPSGETGGPIGESSDTSPGSLGDRPSVIDNMKSAG